MRLRPRFPREQRAGVKGSDANSFVKGKQCGIAIFQVACAKRTHLPSSGSGQGKAKQTTVNLNCLGGSGSLQGHGEPFQPGQTVIVTGVAVVCAKLMEAQRRRGSVMLVFVVCQKGR